MGHGIGDKTLVIIWIPEGPVTLYYYCVYYTIRVLDTTYGEMSCLADEKCWGCNEDSRNGRYKISASFLNDHKTDGSIMSFDAVMTSQPHCSYFKDFLSH